MLEPRPERFTIEPGERIAQLVVVPVVQVEFEVVENSARATAAPAASATPAAREPRDYRWTRRFQFLEARDVRVELGAHACC